MAETYTGLVRNGVVVFEGQPPPLAEGTEVRVEPVRSATSANPEADPVASTRAWLLALAAKIEATAPPLPSDMAEHHDHYAHGKPRP
jgi:hypothetical protein